MRTLLKFILPAIFAAAAFGGVKSFEEIKDEPKGLAKDYYFYRLLTEGDYTKEQAQILLNETSDQNVRKMCEFIINTKRGIPLDKGKI